ncbi:MAG: hypothetical protein AAF609_09075 [Cyanobacteria bacterium P01_C01_bin.120]
MVAIAAGKSAGHIAQAGIGKAITIAVALQKLPIFDPFSNMFCSPKTPATVRG